VVQWTSGAFDLVRAEVWNSARKSGLVGHAKALRSARYALWKNPENLTERQRENLEWIATLNGPLYLAYLMKEQLRLIIATKGEPSLAMLDAWLEWVADSEIPAFVEVGRKIKNNLAGIQAAMTHKLSNALIESTNTTLRVLHRMAFGFKKPEQLIALALLDRGGCCPPLPGRRAA
jgi:transposase